MAWREVTHRVGRACIAGERKSLTAAAAEIFLLFRTRATGLLHPLGAAKRHERRRIVPDVGQRVFAHIPEFEPWNALGRMTRQHLAGGCDIQRAAAPAA